MPRKKVTESGAAPATTRASNRARKSPESLATAQANTSKPRVTKRKAEESNDESKGKKARVTDTTSIAPTKHSKPTPKTTAAKTKAAPTKANGKTTVTELIAPKRKASDEDVEVPRPKKSKTAATASRPIAKATTTKKAPGKAAAPAEAAASKPAVKPATTKSTTKPAPKKSTTLQKVAAPTTEHTAPATVSKQKPAPKAKVPDPAKLVKVLPTINDPPTQRLDVLVFGEGSGGELGLGAKHSGARKVVDVTRPRLNQLLSAKDVGVVQIAVGGMHCAALTHDNKILTWGVNDQGALGRHTDEGPMTDMKDDDESDSDSDDEDSGLNPSEAEPREVDPKHFPAGTKFASLYAGDSSTFALTTTGLVYGWGTFRGNEGIVGFRPEGAKGSSQRTPMLIPELKNIVDIATGTNHVLALDTKGTLYVWGTGEQNQLGRRVIERTSRLALKPSEIGLRRKKIVKIGSGDYHSFAMDDKDNLYSWGLNSFGQTGIPKVGKDEDIVGAPTLVKNLKGMKLKQVTGGSHHTIACTVDGEVLKWGRVESSEAGFDVSNLSDEEVYKEDGKARYLKKPKAVPGLQATFVATANDTCLIVSPEGTAYSWGFSEGYQTGLGVGGDVKLATQIDNTAVRAENLIWAGVGGQFGILAGTPKGEAASKA